MNKRNLQERCKPYFFFFFFFQNTDKNEEKCVKTDTTNCVCQQICQIYVFHLRYITPFSPKYGSKKESDVSDSYLWILGLVMNRKKILKNFSIRKGKQEMPNFKFFFMFAQSRYDGASNKKPITIVATFKILKHMYN